MLTLPDFNRLKVFHYIYTGRSIAEASRGLNITRSAVSQHLKKLEEEIDTPLFTRLPKRLVPTLAAERLYSIVNPFLQELRSGLRMIGQARLRPSGRLRVGAPVEFGKAYFPGFCAAFRRQYPEVSFHLTLGDPDILLPGLRRGALDFALVDVFLAAGKFQGELGAYSIEPVIDEEVILACSREYAGQMLKGDFSYDNLVAHDFIVYQPRALALKGWFRHHFGRQHANPRLALIVDSHQAVIEAVRQGMGMGVVASHLAYEELNSGCIIPVRTGRGEVINRISLVQLQDKVPSLTDKTFQAYVKTAIREAGVLKRFCTPQD
jgi:DNA-binding transcriptional LysR family regulator